LLLAVKRISRKLMEQMLKVQEGLADLSSMVQENVSGIHVVKAYVAEQVAIDKFTRLNKDFTRENLDLARVRGRLMPLMKIASGLGTLMVLSYGGAHVIRGSLSIGDLVAFIGYLNLLAWPTMAMGWMLSILQRGRAAMQRLEHIFLVEPGIGDDPQAQPLPVVRGKIDLNNVEFAYRTLGNGHPVVEGVSFTVRPGQKIAIVGRTGAGKSSIAQLLPRLFDVTGGSILLDGRDIREIPLQQLRGAIACVSQDPFLFSTTIRDNIAFGLDEPTETRIREAAEWAGVAGDVESFPRGYDTIVGERGITLSGGQKQRLTLARALAVDRPILVLDDALSSVDTRTEREILAHLKKLMHGRTSVVIAHRISTIMDADQIVVVDDGRIVDMGDHESLLARDGIYAELFRQQQLEEEIEEL
jgi:ATP-binding cassette subfamily B protein